MAPQQPQSDVEGKKVLVIDDDERNIFAVTSFLESEGLQVISEESGPQGIDRLKQAGDIDVVLMDIKMPGMDGYEAMRQIRQEPSLSSIPIIAVTGKADQKERERCLEAGGSGYISKPIDLDKLTSLLHELAGG